METDASGDADLFFNSEVFLFFFPLISFFSIHTDVFFQNRELEVRINHNLPALAAFVSPLPFPSSLLSLTPPPFSAHIHGPADRDNTGGVLHEFDITEGEANDPITQTFTLTEDEETFLRNGEMYINLHTEDHPDGELRGQVEEGEGLFFIFVVFLLFLFFICYVCLFLFVFCLFLLFVVMESYLSSSSLPISPRL